MTREAHDRAASARARLLMRSRETGEAFDFLLQRYAAERFLYRLGASKYRNRFVLKGSMLFALWGGSVYRPTRDLDFTGYGSLEVEDVLYAFREICRLKVEDDGMVFDEMSLRADPIRDSAEYHGLRIKFEAKLGDARIHMQIDLGFGNAIEPGAVDARYPTLLDLPAPEIRAYPIEAVVAEKLHAMVILGEVNSRYKDFYDLYAVARQFAFDGTVLGRAIAATFERRRTTMQSDLPAALSPRFYADPARNTQWSAYLNRNHLPGVPADFGLVGEKLLSLLAPMWRSIAAREIFNSSWPPGGPWEEQT